MDNVLPVTNSVRRVLVVIGVDVDVVACVTSAVDMIAACSGALGGVGGACRLATGTIGRCRQLMDGNGSMSSVSLVSTTAYFMLGLREIIIKLELCINDDNDACKETCEQ